MSKPPRSFIIARMKNCPEAKVPLQLWRDGEWTFEEALMSIVSQLSLAHDELQYKYDRIPLQVRIDSAGDCF